MAILVFIGGTSTDGTVLANWVIEGGSTAPSSIATTDTLKFNGDSTQACTLSQGTIGCVVIDTTMNHRVTFTASTLNTDAMFFGHNSEIHMGAVNNVVFSGNHASQAGMPHQDHNVVFQGDMNWQSNRQDTVFQLDPGSSTTYISNGQFPRVKLIDSGTFSLNPASSVTGTYATAEMITLEITANITFTNTLLTLGTTKKTLHITSSNYTAGKQFICSATTLDTKNAILRIDADNNQFIPISHDTANFGGSTFKCTLGDLVLGVQGNPDKIYMANGKTLVCDTLEIKKGCVFLGGEGVNEASTIKVAARPNIRGTWNFKTLAQGIYRSNGIEPAGGGGSGDITGVTIQTDSGSSSKAEDTGGSADFSLLGANGVGITNSGATITAVAVPAEIDHDALSNFVAAEHVDWASASAGTIHASNYTDTTTNTQLSNAEVRAAVEAATDSNVFTDADHTKLNGIEASATADQTNAEIRTAVEAATDSNVFTDADHSKLNAIEASATADQSNAEIRAAVEAATDSNVFTDADHTKLNGIAASATAYTDGNAIAACTPLINNNTTLINGNAGAIEAVTDKASKCFVYLSGNQSYSSGTVKIGHDTALWNVGSNYDLTAEYYVAPRDGYYLVACSYYFTSAPSWAMSVVQVDTGSGFAFRIRRKSVNGQDNMISAVIKLNANDKVAHYAHAGGSGTIGASLNTLTYFSVTEMI